MLIPVELNQLILELYKHTQQKCTIYYLFSRVLPFYRKITTFMLLIKFFMSNQWHFDTDNIKDVYSR